MLTEHVIWSNINTSSTLFIVFHGAPPEDFIGNALVIPDWREKDNHNTWPFLATKEAMEACQLHGQGILVEHMPTLDDGDIIRFQQGDDKIEIIWQVRSATNALFLTSSCNSKCLFCPQPSQPDNWRFYEEAKTIIHNVKMSGGVINLTGGEPTLNKNAFLSVLAEMKTSWPTTRPFILTNGRAFRDRQFTQSVFSIYHGDEIGFAVPLYADAASIHDKIVGVKGAFGETIRGLYALAIYHTEIEIRFVVSRLSVHRLPALIGFIGRNLPFITRIAVMGIEPMGVCRANWEKFWIDPEDCPDILTHAAQIADNYGLTLLLYNFQLCCLPEPLRERACTTISEWKCTYLPACHSCPQQYKCGGFFASQNESKYLPRRFSRNVPNTI